MKLLLSTVLTAALLVGPLPDANAQPAPADHGTGTPAECARWGCLYGHERGHWTRDGYVSRVAYGIAADRLPDGPDGRYFIRVMWPDGYDPSRRSLWDQVAHCESTWRWHLDSAYDGGLQFSPQTWQAYGGTDFAHYAWQALPEQQITVAERVLRLGYGQHGPQGAGAWPHCARGVF